MKTMLIIMITSSSSIEVTENVQYSRVEQSSLITPPFYEIVLVHMILLMRIYDVCIIIDLKTLSTQPHISCAISCIHNLLLTVVQLIFSRSKLNLSYNIINIYTH